MAENRFYSYESLMNELKATQEARRGQYECTAHLLSNLDRSIRENLFNIEDATVNKSFNIKDIQFNFDEFMDDLSNKEASEIPYEGTEHNFGGQERKHVCSKPGCNKSYTSSHGLKYHMLHGHSKEKENAYKPFVCNIPSCGKTYRNSNGLKYHMSKAHSKQFK
ncbi:hypothetical protein NUSPORA_01588 [Nucleospora cyclopteri]